MAAKLQLMRVFSFGVIVSCQERALGPNDATWVGSADMMATCQEFRGSHGQDRFIFDHFFQYLFSPEDGRMRFFVEAGAADGLAGSNSFAFERLARFIN